MKTIYGVYESGSYLISNEEFGIEMNMNDGEAKFTSPSIPLVAAFGCVKADVVEIDRNSFIAIFGLANIVNPNIIYKRVF